MIGEMWAAVKTMMISSWSERLTATKKNDSQILPVFAD